ncbi:transcriptional regulator [Salmonella enterica]|nr:transcriptional regulator [Salmonella enterica]
MHFIEFDVKDSFLLFSKGNAELLKPGEMPEHQFLLLIELSPIHSEKLISALKDFLVLGYTRREVCEQHNISSGYFSGALGKVKKVIFTVTKLLPYYVNNK